MGNWKKFRVFPYLNIEKFNMDMKILVMIVVVAVVVSLIYLATAKKNNDVRDDDIGKQPEALLDIPVNFGYKCMWIAVKTNDKEKIAQLLGLKNTHPQNWKTGIEDAYSGKIFITPQVGEWTLIVGNGLAGKNSKSELDEAHSYEEKIIKLSKEFGEAQFFATHRVTEYHVWAKAIKGKIVRFYSFIGERGENILVEGEPTSAEKRYNLINTFSKEAEDEKYFETTDLVFPEESLVMKIAANWSVDPTTLEERKDIKPDLGIEGE